MEWRFLLWTHALTGVITLLLTSGIWLTAYFVAVEPNIKKSSIINNYTNNYCPSENGSCKTPEMPKCSETCEFVVCESIPVGMVFNASYPTFNSTTECWMRLMNEAKSEIIIGSYYWSLLVQDTGDGYNTDPSNTSSNGQLIYEKLLSVAKDKNVSVRIAQTYEEGGYMSSEFWYPGGILHTKSWSVDGKHFYIGSANFDWRSLTHVKELGVAAFNCPCIANDLKNLLEIYWAMGAPGSQIPKQWDDRYSTPANHQTPMSVIQPYGSQAMYISASPPGFQACGREDDLTAMIKTIDEAKEYVYLAVMDYSPSTLYMKDANKWKPELDNAIRRAAFERAVHVKFMISLWPHTYPDIYGFMFSLQDISEHLPCYQHDDTGACVKKGSIEVRFVEVPTMQFSQIPYARVYHNKYFVTESAAYIGTSNWSSDYWQYTAGIGFVVQADDSTAKSHLVRQFTSVFERDWGSSYTIPLENFTISGNKTTRLS